MKKMWLVAGIVFLFILGGLYVTQVHAARNNHSCVCGYFIDENGDGICDLCSGCIPRGYDDDGDGIPNGQDDDYIPPQDGTGRQKGR